MTRWMRALAIAALAATVASCAPRAAPLPPAVAVPRFPDFLFPAVPQGLGTPAALERHDVAWRWLQAGDLRAAERNFQSALKQSPAFYPAETGLGYIALAQKRHKESLLHFDRAVVANPRYTPALVGRAESLLALGEQEEALQSLEAAVDADPGLDTLRSRIQVLRFRNQQQDIAAARALAESGRLDEARTAYREALAASPESPFLHRELAAVEQRSGNTEAAIESARRAVELDPDDARAHLMLADIYEGQGSLAEAIASLSAAAAVAPDPALDARLDALRAREAFEAMPAEYREIERAPVATRAQLAALLAVRLNDLLARAPRVNAVVITDARGSWASSYILAAARAGVMEIYPNHTFQPHATVRRVDLAQAASRVLEIIARGNPALAAEWRDANRPTFPDVAPRHLHYPAASLAVEAGVLPVMPDGRFDLTAPVSGAEAVAAVARLQDLAAQRAR